MQAHATFAHRARPRGKGAANSPGLGRAFKYLGHYRSIAAVAYLSLILSTGAQLMVPQLVQRILDTITNGFIAHTLLKLPTAFQALGLQKLGWTAAQLASNADNAESALITVGLILVGFAVMSGLFSFGQGYMGERLSQSVAFDLRNELFAKVQRLSFSYHDRTQTGQLMIRATDDVEKLRMFIGQGLMMVLQALLFLIGTLTILFLTNAKLTLAVLPVLPVALVLFMIFGAISRPLFTEVQKRLSTLNTVLQENMAGIKVVKSFAREPEEQARFEHSAESLMRQQLVVNRLFSFLFPFVFLIANLGQAAVMYFGGKQILAGTLTLGEWQKFSMYLIYLFFPMGMLGMIIAQMSQATASAMRIFEILDAKNDVVDKPDAILMPPTTGRVTFENVTFRYFGSAEPVLCNVSFDALPGQTIALLGATGSGKTTIINLVPRFYDASEGRVLVDGYDVRDVTLDSLRLQIGIVLQDTTLFSGTVRDNIAFGRPDASMDDVIAAAKAAVAHEFIMGFTQGYDTPVGERGVTLSGGQKQRIAIARALLLDPHILILDDSTSSVDVATEYQIQKALDKLMQGRTSFVIAQRISTVLNADQILVLDKGEIVARGQHEELMENSPLYAEIYHSQLIEDAALTDDSTRVADPNRQEN